MIKPANCNWPNCNSAMRKVESLMYKIKKRKQYKTQTKKYKGERYKRRWQHDLRKIERREDMYQQVMVVLVSTENIQEDEERQEVCTT
ncbi:hypothetical protein POVCU1_028480 [Plasmodium ovale curtisi]|uniref:Uncharacterized protein n=1 Tax=Plasmodium ovale curtisi TaxID=864141 RepID=A0A1A8WNP7_PLAOA|nr:hypothetical protein POVCU1_028480 [Plasmodium ovale curtisi]